MNYKQTVPFFESKDDFHCFQACLKMALSFWWPDKNFTWEELDQISGHSEYMWTWQGQTILHLVQNGFEVINIENLDYNTFAWSGESYLRTIWNDEVFTVQSLNSNLSKEQEIAKELVNNKHIKLINKEIKFSDAVDLMNRGYLVLVSVNPFTLRGEEGYSSHMVVVTEVADTKISYHDPGPPGKKNMVVSKEIFEKSMTKPEKEDGNIIGIRPAQPMVI